MKFKGVDFPEVYLVDFHQEENPLEEYPLSGDRGNFVCSLLGTYSLLDKTRIANWTVQGESAVVEDIKKTEPKVVVAFGRESLNLINTSRKITEISGEVFDCSFDGFETKLIPIVSPSYVLQRIEDSSVSLKFSQDLYKAFQIVNGEYVDILKEKEVLSAHSFEEFKEIYETRFIDDTEIAYDIETNARPPMTSGSEIVGFSIGNNKSGVYVSQDSLDFHMDKSEIDQIWDYLINEVFEKKDKLIIHNTMYERPYTLYCKGYEIGFEKAHDTLVMARLLKGAKEGAGLKYQTQKNLHYPDWETDLGSYIQGVRGFIDRVGLGPKKFQGIYSKIKDGTSVFDLTGSAELESLGDADKEEVLSLVDKILVTVCDLYSEEELENIGHLISDKVVSAVDQGGILDSTVPYNWIPDKVLSKYGAVDSLATYDLKTYYFNMMDEDSTDKVDLHKGYENWLEHMYVAYIMERNGMYWDDEMAQKDREFLSDQATRCMKTMLKSPVFKFKIKDTCEWKYKPVILSDYFPQIAISQGFNVSYSKDTGKYVVYFNGKRVSKSRISEIEILENYRSQYDELLYQMFYEEVDRATSYEELKVLYNPASSTSTDVPRQILLTPDLQMGGRIVNLHTLSTSPEFEGLKESLPFIDKKFLNVADLLCSPDRLKETYKEDWARMRKSLFEGFKSLYNSSPNVVTPEIVNILSEKEPVQIDSFDDGGVITIYNNLVVTGMDQDDPSTWSPEFEWMINFRLFKKSYKLISSYIDGSVGRQSVAVVDRVSLSRGDHCVERKRGYYQGRASSNEDYLLMAKWSPNTAETGRWRSAQHCHPGWSKIALSDGTSDTVESLYKRFKSGEVLEVESLCKETSPWESVRVTSPITQIYTSGEYGELVRVWVQGSEDSEPHCFDVTPNHKLIRDDGYVDYAVNFSEGDVLPVASNVKCLQSSQVPEDTAYSYVSEDYVHAYCALAVRDPYLQELKSQYEPSSFTHSHGKGKKITKIEYLKFDRPIQTYSISINRTSPNYSVSAGVIISNTVPWGSQVKKYYSSRFVGGTTCCPDYSQMEVRTLAAISKDKNMLDLFYSGKDFHTETAKKIYRKDEVTTAERRFSKTATFSLLYGAMEDSFAKNYCNGDMEYAKMVYGGFFEAYPDVKKWVDERHEEVQKDHRVSLELSNRFIPIHSDGEGRGALNSMLRKSQNYPIQAQSADLTGCVIFDLQKYIEEHHLKSLVFMYVHDSIEVDIYPYELFEFISYLKVLLNESPMRRMGLPSKADVALGKSLGHEIELEEIEMNEEMTEGTMVLKGYKDEIDETVENWKKAYAVVEVSEEEYKDEFVSMGELFILRKAYTPNLGVLRHHGKCKVHIKYYE